MVKIYSRENCEQCKMTKKRFIKSNIEFVEISLDEHEELADGFRAKGYRELPVVETELETWTGFRPQNIRKLKAALTQGIA